MATKEKSTFSHFFKEDAEHIQDIIKGTNGQSVANKLGAASKEIFPRLNGVSEVSEAEITSKWRVLRSFFRSGISSEEFKGELSPVIMSPLYTDTLVGTEFPVWVADESFEGDGARCLSLKEMFTQCLKEIAPEESDAHILKENIARIIHIANKQLANNKPQLFESAVQNILDELENQLEVSGDEVSKFNASLKALKDVLPSCGALLPYSNNTSFQLLEAAMITTHSQARKKLAYDISQLKCRLKDLLRVEREKNPNEAGGAKTKESYDFADSMMNIEKISTMDPGAGAESMGPERVERITGVVAELELADKMLTQTSFLFVDEIVHANKSTDWKSLFEDSEVKTYKKGEGCDAINVSFAKNISSWTKLFVAKRIGELEFESSYMTDVHDDYFTHFGWENFSSEELSNCPHFVLIADDVQLFETELSKLSSTLTHNIPIKIVAVKRDNYGTTDVHSQTELGALMISHKNIFVAQSTSITPTYLFDGFANGLNSFAPAFFNVLNVDQDTHENPYLWTSASVESREFPGFTFNGILGTSWGSRFEVTNNPQANEKYPIHTLSIINEEGEKVEMDFPFTFADQAALNPAFHSHFINVDSSYWNENLISITDYIENSDEDNVGKVPFVWMMNTANELQKVAVSWPLVLATQERLDFWRFLQENSGINNYHVSKALATAKEDFQANLDAAVAQLKEEHAAEIQAVRDEESGKVMENLTSVLLNLDTSNVLTTSATAPSSAPASASTEVGEAVVEEAPAVEEESTLSNDPYIDTALCTSCNECTNMNGQLFKYNGDKMAFIADPKAGTFNELVEAAELCPVAIIHPGSPLDPNEADLDSLVERAAKFN
jgi:ferredoxin